MEHRAWVGGVVGCVLVLLAGLGAVQLHAQRQFFEQGRSTAFPEPIADTGMPRACVNTALEQYAGAELPWALDTIAAGGFTWVQQRFPWAEIQPEPDVFAWEAWDAIIAGAVERGLQVLPVLTAPPAWAGTPPDPEAFARFAGAFANHYSAQLVYYQIGHNPNLGDAWGGKADPYLYAELLASAATAIRAADPDARIVLGGLAPNVEQGPVNYAEDRFLDLLYTAGAAPYFDVVAIQPYGFDTGPEDRRVDRGMFNFSRAVLVREVLAAHDDADKALWISHFGWNSLPAAGEDVPSIWGSVNAQTQADYTVAALERAEEEWPWMGVMCLNGFQPRPPEGEPQAIPDAEEHWGFAIVGPDGEPRPVYTAVQAWTEHPRVAQPGVYPAGTEWADFSGSWRWGPLGADIGRFGDSKVRFTFEGTDVALTVRRGPYRAFLFVTVDGEPAPALPRDAEGRAYLVLYDPLSSVATVPLAEHLPEGQHTVEVVADRGWYQWSLVDWRVSARPDPLPYRLGLAAFGALGVAGVVLATLAARRVDWRAAFPRLTSAYRRLSEPVQVALTTVAGGVFGVAAWLTWMQDAFRRLGEGTGLTAVLLAAGLFYVSPWLWVTLVSGVILFALVLLRPELGLALTIAAAPLYLHPVSLFGKSFSLAELFLLPTLSGVAIRVFGDHGLGLRRRAFRDWARRVGLLPLAAFVLVALLSTVTAQYRHEALRELRLVILEPVLFYSALVTLPLERRDRRRIVDFYVGSAVLIAVVGLVQYFVLGDVITAEGGFPRLRSIYGSPNNVGLYLVRVIPLMLAVVIWGGETQGVSGLSDFWRGLRRSPRCLLYTVTLAPVGLALLLSFSRGALLLGVPAGLLALGLLAGRRWRRVTWMVLLVFVIVLVLLFQTPRFASLLDMTQGTTFFRLSLWRSAWSMVRDHPWLGAGPDNFLYAYRTRYVLPTAWEEFNLSHPHNWMLDFASRLGVLGLLAFLWMQSAFWRQVCLLLRSRTGQERAWGLGMAASMLGGLAHGLVDASYFYIDLAFVFFLTFAVVQWETMDE